MHQASVEYTCPCASLTDDISCFSDSARFVLSLRGDDIISPTKDFVRKLADITGREIISLSDYMQAVSERLKAFKECGCCFSDHALDNGFTFLKNDQENDKRFGMAQDEDLNEGEKTIGRKERYHRQNRTA